mmetsp:Transcript_55060/g.126442  ORF Transcript_55060/g.126442 Transcript_55060/m.126442 type:complete len:240 (-) Transcript_55060:218-937(-)
MESMPSAFFFASSRSLTIAAASSSKSSMVRNPLAWPSCASRWVKMWKFGSFSPIVRRNSIHSTLLTLPSPILSMLLHARARISAELPPAGANFSASLSFSSHHFSSTAPDSARIAAAASSPKSSGVSTPASQSAPSDAPNSARICPTGIAVMPRIPAASSRFDRLRFRDLLMLHQAAARPSAVEAPSAPYFLASPVSTALAFGPRFPGPYAARCRATVDRTSEDFCFSSPRAPFLLVSD